MKQIILRPYNFLVVFAILFILFSFFTFSNSIDFHLHDTMFVVAIPHLFWLIAILLLFFSFIYKVTNRILFSNYLTWFHIIITLLFLIIISFPLWGYNPPLMYIDASPWTSFNRFHYINRMISWLIILFLLAQLLLLINIIAGFIKKLRTKPI